MTPKCDDVFYKLDGGYTVTRLDSRECALIFRDNQHRIVALLEGCRDSLTGINPHKGRALTQQEKTLLQRYVCTRGLKINAEVADFLNLSILRQENGKERYLSERRLTRRLARGIIAQSLYVSKLQSRSLKIGDYSRIGSCNLSNALVKKLTIGHNCDINLDLRDNQAIHAVRIGENYNGNLLLSRSTVESVVLANNCRCDMTMTESKNCFNLIIGDVYSGNLYIKDSCFHNIEIGYYCYADIVLEENWGRRAVSIGDSFRGILKLDNVEVYRLELGKDCKGQISVTADNSHNSSREIYFAEDFAGTLDLQNATGIERLTVGSHARGRINLLGNNGIKIAQFDKYFNGYADFSNSSVEYVSADYGSSGNLLFNQCDKLILVELPRYKNSKIISEKEPIEIAADSNSLYYRYQAQYLPYSYFSPFYKKIFHNMRHIFS